MLNRRVSSDSRVRHEYGGAPEQQEQQANIAIHGEKRSIHFAEVVRLYKRMLVSEQCRYHTDAHPCRPPQMKAPSQPYQQPNHQHVHGAGEKEGFSNPDGFRNRMEALPTIEIDVLAGIEHVEPTHPESDSGAENQHAPIERAPNRNPGSGWRNSQAKAENEV